jgi:hypothetical protein
MDPRTAILAELAEWHDETGAAPSNSLAAAELIALSQLAGAPEELQDRAAAILCPEYL